MTIFIEYIVFGEYVKNVYCAKVQKVTYFLIISYGQIPQNVL